MNIEFWSIMAQVSATFVGLVFVGLSIYLSSIRTAVSEIESNLGMAEQTSRIMVVSVLSNLSFFALPLIASLGLIARQGGLNNLIWLAVVADLLLLVVLLWGHHNKTTQQQVKLILDENVKKARKLHRLRFEFSKWLLYLAVVMYIVFLLLIVFLQGALWVENLLEVVTVLSIIFGLCYGIIDLILFDVNNILFQVSDKLCKRIDRAQRDFHEAMQEIRDLYREYETVVQGHHYQEELIQAMQNPHLVTMLGLDQSRIQEQAQIELAAIRSTYQKLCEEIPQDREAKIIQQIRAKGDIVQYADLKTFKEQNQLLSEDIKSYRDLLKGKLEFFKERDLIPDRTTQKSNS